MRSLLKNIWTYRKTALLITALINNKTVYSFYCNRRTQRIDDFQKVTSGIQTALESDTVKHFLFNNSCLLKRAHSIFTKSETVTDKRPYYIVIGQCSQNCILPKHKMEHKCWNNYYQFCNTSKHYCYIKTRFLLSTYVTSIIKEIVYVTIQSLVFLMKDSI